MCDFPYKICTRPIIRWMLKREYFFYNNDQVKKWFVTFLMDCIFLPLFTSCWPQTISIRFFHHFYTAMKVLVIFKVSTKQTCKARHCRSCSEGQAALWDDHSRRVSRPKSAICAWRDAKLRPMPQRERFMLRLCSRSIKVPFLDV